MMRADGRTVGPSDGFVPHHDRHPLHGITVVLDTHDAKTYVGRLDSADASGVLLRDAGIHVGSGEGGQRGEGGAAESRESYLRATLKYGVRKLYDSLIVPNDQVASIVTLGEWESRS